MAKLEQQTIVPHLTLQALTAAELMSDNPISLRKNAGIRDAIALMTDRGFAAAPVIDESGRPIGVITVTDILIHDREFVSYLKTGDPTVKGKLRTHARLPADMGIEVVDRTTIGEIMTPAIFTVMENATAAAVVQTLLSLRIHHLFVSDRQGILVGVISMGDILRKLK
jgi:CBS domain-containing protein